METGQPSPEAKLEHRLSKIEFNGVQTLEQITRLATSVTAQNGRVGVLEEWREKLAEETAYMRGLVAGRSGLRKGEIALLMGLLSAASMIGAIVSLLIQVAEMP